MRYTVENMLGRPVRVYLDGIEQDRVVEADDELGFVIRMKVGSDGRPQIGPTACRKEIVLGKVDVSIDAPR
jgi:hypothetical protein